MSGGADFEPRGVRPPEPERVARAPRPEPKSLVFPVSAENLVVKAALGPSKTVKAGDGPLPGGEGAEVTRAAFSQSAGGLNTGFALVREPAATITLASIEKGVLALRQETVEPEAPELPAVPEPVRDIREVRGTRVNMRDGPGTIYPVIAKLTIGHEVEVLDDPGIGWLRLRVLPEQQVGWIASSLISKKAD
ncbi:SH3 domain-containing protein [Ruegeria sediminis]|uniref:SH3 domain-containing protein n=2 Tax=Ruegeria sediminis TaxID=2583820 RepID=A0ABY2WSS2_9RHOB|nr:SH3 domain-containing protein [Ruegeria sediminis]